MDGKEYVGTNGLYDVFVSFGLGLLKVACKIAVNITATRTGSSMNRTRDFPFINSKTPLTTTA